MPPETDRDRPQATAIRQLRARLALSQRAFADRVGVPQSTIYRWESGQVTPSGRHLAAIHDLAELHGFEFTPFGTEEKPGADRLSPEDELSAAALRMLREQIAFCETLDRLKTSTAGNEVWRILGETVKGHRKQLGRFLDELAKDPAREFHFWKAISVLKVFAWRAEARREGGAYVRRDQMIASPDPFGLPRK